MQKLKSTCQVYGEPGSTSEQESLAPDAKHQLGLVRLMCFRVMVLTNSCRLYTLLAFLLPQLQLETGFQIFYSEDQSYRRLAM